MNSTRTPLSVTPAIAAMCAKVSPGAKPVFLAIQPDEGAEPGFCFQAVSARVAKEGGRMQTGWAIWEWPDVYVEAEHHAVYETPEDRRWIDVTPSSTPGEARRLFLPDDSAVYNDSEDAPRRDNYRRPLTHDPNIREFCQLAAGRTALMNTVMGYGVVSVSGYKARKLLSIEARLAELQGELVNRYTPRNARCPCDSGKKFKVCCLR